MRPLYLALVILMCFSASLAAAPVRIALVPLDALAQNHADLVLASSAHWAVVLAGVALWGVHLGMTQGLLAALVADTVPADLRGTG